MTEAFISFTSKIGPRTDGTGCSPGSYTVVDWEVVVLPQPLLAENAKLVAAIPPRTVCVWGKENCWGKELFSLLHHLIASPYHSQGKSSKPSSLFQLFYFSLAIPFYCKRSFIFVAVKLHVAYTSESFKPSVNTFVNYRKWWYSALNVVKRTCYRGGTRSLTNFMSQWKVLTLWRPNIIKGIKQMENLLIGSLTSRRLQAFKCFVAAVQCRLYCHFTSMVKRPCEQQRFVFLKTTKELLGSKMENTLSI